MEALHLTQTQKAQLDAGFAETFGGAPERYFSAPGRTEIGGNHTDHQRGRVLAAAVNLDTLAAVRCNGTEEIRILSQGYPMCVVRLNQLEPVAEEVNSTPALIRGVAARFHQLGCQVQGFDAYCISTVLPGSGLSSSAAFEVLIGTIINHLFFDARVSQPEIAQIGQYAENVFFGQALRSDGSDGFCRGQPGDHRLLQKRCPGDSSGELRLLRLRSCPVHHRHPRQPCGFDRRIRSHPPGNPKGMRLFRQGSADQIPEEDFYAAIPALRTQCGDRAVMRCIHFYQDNARVPQQVAALEAGDFDRFLELVKESGRSSWMYLQNVIPAGYKEHQDVAISLALCQHYLQGRGAYRVHGGGFAGTVQAFVPFDLLESFRTGIDAALGEGACHVLSIRPQGGVEAF